MADVVLEGWDEFINKAGGLPKELEEEFAGEVELSAQEWEDLAKLAAPKDQGFLAQNIKAVEVSTLEWDVAVSQFYGPYMEFGTKKKVIIPPGLEAYAAEFKGQRQGGNAKAQIYAWMARVGIPADKQWGIFINLVVNGVKPHPFLFPQEAIVEPKFIKNIQNIVNTEH